MVDDDVVCVDATLGQLLDQPLRLVEGEELSDTHTDEGGLFLVDVRKVGKGEELRTHNTIHLSCIRGQMQYKMRCLHKP